MRALLLTYLLLASLAYAQHERDLGPFVKAKVPAGAVSKRLALRLKTAAKARDRFVLVISTKKLVPVLITPDGNRIDKANAERAGLSWDDSDMTAPLGSTDGGVVTTIEFVRLGKAGVYTVEFTAQSIEKPAWVSVRFISEQKEYAAITKSLPGFKTSGPVVLTARAPFATLPITLDQDEEGAIFDIVVTDPGAKVSLTLPDGRTIDSKIGKTAGIEWKTFKNASEADQPESWFGISGFLLRREGTHHVVTFEKAIPGDYHVSAQTSASAAVELTAGFIPLGRIFSEAAKDIDKLGSPRSGEVRLQPWATFPYDCYVGDKLDLMVGLKGDPVDASSLKLEVRLEYTEILPRTGKQGAQFGPPVVVPVPVTLTRNSDNRYTGSFVPDHPGILRVGVHAEGKRTNGKPFTDDTILPQVTVHRVAARFLRLTEKAHDFDGNGTLDRLDITADLDVVIPGEYEMRVFIQGPDSLGTYADGRETLTKGKQMLTVSVPAKRVRDYLQDGPWTISRVQIFRPVGDTFGDFVATDRELRLQTAAYKREQWDQGVAWGEETATVRGIRPGVSGRFRMVEVDWKVFTPGGRCSWTAVLSMDGYGMQNVLAEGILPQGSSVLNFVFNGAVIAVAPKKEWYFHPIVNCDFGSFSGDRPQWLMHVSLDPVDFEPQPPSFHVTSQTMVRVAPGGSGAWTVDVHGKKYSEVTFRITGSEPGVVIGEARPSGLNGAAQARIKVEVDRAVKPGRYFIPITATVGTDTAATDLVIDVVR